MGFSPRGIAVIPRREVATANGQTYFVTSNTAGRKPFFRHERWDQLFIDVLSGYRLERYLLHGFVVMPDHFHVLITPKESLDKAVQMIKGGFSFRAKKELDWRGDVWLAGFADHRIRDAEDFEVYQRYILRNPVKARLSARGEEYAYCSANGRFDLDEFPRGLKPGLLADENGAAEAAPLQSASQSREVKGKSNETACFQGDSQSREVKGKSNEAAPLQSASQSREVKGKSKRTLSVQEVAR